MNKKFCVLVGEREAAAPLLPPTPHVLLVPPPDSAAVRKCTEMLPLRSKAGQDRLSALTSPLKSLTGQGFEREEEAFCAGHKRFMRPQPILGSECGSNSSGGGVEGAGQSRGTQRSPAGP
jgi:hypothetical protein